MAVVTTACLILFGITAAYFLWLTPRIWTGRKQVSDQPPPKWPYSDIRWRSTIRSVAPITAASVGMAGLSICAFLISAPDGSGLVGQGQLRGATVITLVFCGAFALGSGIVAACTGWLSRPKFLIPPGLRDQPGAWHEWQVRRRHKRAKPPDHQEA